jgi:hypothetical protein
MFLPTQNFLGFLHNIPVKISHKTLNATWMEKEFRVAKNIMFQGQN